MTTSSLAHSSADVALRRRGTVLLGVAGGAALAVLLVAVATPGPTGDEPLPAPVRVDTAPAATDAAARRVAALDAGVDWSRVSSAPEEAGTSVAAYDR
jgi:hypothetical protein